MAQFSFGWVPDRPDFRDWTPEHEDKKNASANVSGMLAALKVEGKGAAAPATSKDLREWCSPIEDQGQIGSCTAHAGVGILEYFERRAFGRHIDGSRLFLYKVTRDLLGWTGDTGAFLRTTMGAMKLFGVPPERFWPYTDQAPDWNREPDAFLFAFAQNYQAVRYFRLDPAGIDRNELLMRIKRYLSAYLPSMFGFTVYSSYTQADANGEFPYPSQSESAVGGHAVVAVGFDDEKKITNLTDGSTTRGALRIRNSWGTGWGEHGYGWLPYEYVLRHQATDWWSLMRAEWTDTSQFGVDAT